jgi:hypothetical protein
MAASIHRLRTRADRVRVEDAAQLRQMVIAFPGLPVSAVNEIVATIDRETVSRSGWTFVMLSPEQNLAVVRWLRHNSALPMIALELWAECFQHLRADTGEIVATRDELATAVGANSDNVSRIMSELEGVGAVMRQRERVPGMRGRGRVRYFINPRIATHLPGQARDKAQADAPLLKIIEGQAGK